MRIYNNFLRHTVNILMDLFLLGTGAAEGGFGGIPPVLMDTGGGLTFAQDDLHYVSGIASAKLKHPKPFVLFTDINNLELFSWLCGTIQDLEREDHDIL